MPLPDTTAVPPAHGGTITDQVLEATAAAFGRAAQGTLSDADGALILIVGQAAMTELLQWRKRGEMIRDLVSEKILMFPGGR